VARTRGDRFHGLSERHVGIDQRGQSEVRQAGVVVGIDQDVRWLDVTMQYAKQVRSSQCVRDPYADLANPTLARSRISSHPPCQGTARTQLHDQERPIIPEQASIVHRDDAGVARHSARRTRFAEEAPLLGFGVQLALVDLDRDQPVQ
jgi:hypothetical protein